MEKNPQVALPTSKDPEALVRAWMKNYVNYINTGNEKFLQFFVDGMNSEVADKLRAERQTIAGYQAQQHSKYHLSIPTGDKGVKVVEDMTTLPAGGTTITADVNVETYLDNRAYTPYANKDIRKQFTVGEFQRNNPDASGASVDVFLPTYISDLGAPPVDSSTKSAYGRPKF